MTSGLSGITVLVTRPRDLAEPLYRGVRAAGGDAILWPTVDIRPQTADGEIAGQLARAGPGAVVIFVSRNAVRYGAELLPTGARPTIAAIGPSTAAALGDYGITPDIVPAGYDSESLLAAPELREMNGRHVFIVRGADGRGLLGRTLAERGANVAYLEVYRRERARHSPSAVADLLRRWERGGIDIFTATSVAIYDNLSADLGPDGLRLMNATALVTASRRVVKRAQEAGHHAPQLMAPGPDDESFLETITSWRAVIGPSSSVTDQNNE